MTLGGKHRQIFCCFCGCAGPSCSEVESNLQVTPGPRALPARASFSWETSRARGAPWYFWASEGCRWNSRSTRPTWDRMELGLDFSQCEHLAWGEHFLFPVHGASSISTELASSFPELSSHTRGSPFDRSRWFSPILCPRLLPSSCTCCRSDRWSSGPWTLWEVSSQ